MRNNSINRPRIILFYFSLSFYILQIIYNPPKEKNYSTLIVFFSFLLPEKFFVHQFLSYRINNPPQHLNIHTSRNAQHLAVQIVSGSNDLLIIPGSLSRSGQIGTPVPEPTAPS